LLSTWHLENGRGIRILRGLTRQLTKVCFSSDGRWLAAGSHAWEVGLWDLHSSQLGHVFEMPLGLVTADNVGMAFSLDCAQFAFVAGRNALRFDVESLDPLQGWRLPPGFVDERAFDPLGRLLAFRLEPADKSAEELRRPYK